MGILATGSITLSSVNDACAVLLSKSSCTVKAAFDGSNQDLSSAYTDISLVRGEVKIPISSSNITVEVPTGVTYTTTKIDDGTQRVTITAIPQSSTSCEVGITLTSGGFTGKVVFSIAIMRDNSMLDWIQDWESNKTKIGSTYILTPKIYAGNVTEGENGVLNVTGVYMGPDASNGAGIYGYLNNNEIFHLNSTGGSIGGWNIENGGIQTSDGRLQILSEGTMKGLLEDNTVAWALYKNGSASFAKGNVLMNANGSASFKGSITAGSGSIGGWTIKEGYIHANNILLRSSSPLIGVSSFGINSDATLVGGYLEKVVKIYGGVAMHFSSDSDFGIVAYLRSELAPSPDEEPTEELPDDGVIEIPTEEEEATEEAPAEGVEEGISLMSEEEAEEEAEEAVEEEEAISAFHKIFSLGSTNMIAGWNISDDALYLGSKANTYGSYTSATGNITIGSRGIRGYGWRIDANGDVSLGNGRFSYTKSNDTAKIAGWNLNSNSISSDHIHIASTTNLSGLFISTMDLSSVAIGSMAPTIVTGSGIYMTASDSQVCFSGFNGGKCQFCLGTAGNIIAGWSFNDSTIWAGGNTSNANGFAVPEEGKTAAIMMESTALRGTKWVLNADGSGKLANGAISWDTNGNITFASDASINWGPIADDISAISGVGNKLTQINADGIYTGTISADKITAGTLSTATIQNVADTWELNQDGSGKLAAGMMTWTNDGIIKIKGSMRNPFDSPDDSFDEDYGDNIVVEGGGGFIMSYSLPWDVGQSGRRLVIASGPWDGTSQGGSASFNAPTGKYFYENGVKYSKLSISNEYVELMGYGSATTFFGWIVANRFNLVTTRRYGRDLRCLCMGKMFAGGSATYKTGDGTLLNAGLGTDGKEHEATSRVSAGIYRIYFPTNSSGNSLWFSDASDINIQITPLTLDVTIAVTTLTTTYCEIKCCRNTLSGTYDSEDSYTYSLSTPLVDASFFFHIYNMNDWYGSNTPVE